MEFRAWFAVCVEAAGAQDPRTSHAEETTGIPAETLRDVARGVAEARTVCGLWAMGVTQHSMGSDTSTAISNLLLATGNYGRPGTGGYPLRGHNNVQGCSDMGSVNTYFPGYQKVEDAAEYLTGAFWWYAKDTDTYNYTQIE